MALRTPLSPADALLAFLDGDSGDDTQNADNGINARADSLIADSRARDAAPVAPTPRTVQPSPLQTRPAISPTSSFQRPANVASPANAFGEFMQGGRGAMPNSGGTNDAVELASLRGGRAGELKDRLIQDNAVGDRVDGKLAGGYLADLEGDMANDPNTGAAAHAQTAATNKTIQDASLKNQSPMIDQQHHQEQFEMSKLLEPEKLKQAGETTRTKLQGDAMRDVANTKGDAMLGVADTKAYGTAPKLSNDEINVMDKLNQTKIMGPQALQLMEQAHPGISQDPNRFKSWTDSMGAKVGGVIYKHGGPQTTSEAHINQVVGYLGEVIPRMVVNSVRSKQLLDDLKLHAPQVGFSDGENYERLKYVMDYILPATERAIQETHGQASAAPAYDANDPSTWKRVQ